MHRSEFFMRFVTKPPGDVALDPTALGSVKVLKCTPAKPNGKAILYIHGGGWFLPLMYGQKVFAAQLAKATQTPVYAIEYRLAPEHPFPAALDDALEAYKELIGQGVNPNAITVIGDSAGGNLTLALLLKLKQQMLPLPGSTIALSPATDFNFTGESILSRAEIDPLLAVGDPRVLQQMYVREDSLDNPLISPLLGDLSGLPSLLILVGGREILYSDSINFAKKAKDSGVDVTLDVEEDMFHVYPIFYNALDEAKIALGKMALFIKNETRMK